ncbi:unnamed protein product [Lampetra planeri]
MRPQHRGERHAAVGGEPRGGLRAAQLSGRDPEASWSNLSVSSVATRLDCSPRGDLQGPVCHAFFRDPQCARRATALRWEGFALSQLAAH